MSINTSPSPANIAFNGNLTTWWIPATNTSNLVATGVKININVNPVQGLKVETWSAEIGSFNTLNGIWSIGTLQPGETKWLKLITKVIDIGLAPFTLTSVISGNNIDPNNTNNTLVQTITSVVTSVTAGAVADIGCSCGNVSTNDIACNYGVTEWRLILPVINSTNYTWNTSTGEYKFIHDNPYEDITANYSIWCDPGTGFVEVSGPVSVKINKLFEDVSSLNHVITKTEYSALSIVDKAVLTTQYVGLDLSKFCWNILRNSEGELTSGIPIECEENKDTRTFYLCTDQPCEEPLHVCCDGTLPEGITLPIEYNNPQKGDTIIVQHPFSISVWVYTTKWERNSCGCIEQAKPISNISFSGTNTKTLTITYSDGSTQTASFVDLQGGVGSGEVNTASNVGSGEGVFYQKTGVDLEFRSIKAGDNVLVVDNDDEIVISTKNCPQIYLDLLPQVSNASSSYLLRVNGISNIDPAWGTWKWQVAYKFGTPGISDDGILDDVNPNPIWGDVQTGDLLFDTSGDDSIVRVKLTVGECVYYSNESGYQPNVKCDGSIKVEAFLYGSTVVAPVVMNDGNVAVKGLAGYSPNKFVFQIMDTTIANRFDIFTDVQTGEDISGKLIHNGAVDGGVYRIKYTRDNGCVYYSNFVTVFFP